MRISPETVQQIIQAADVTEVIGEYVSLKKRGANMIACCPFHNEKTPSFYVSPAKGIYKCFGCGKAGDSVRFVMDIEGIGYPEALKHLAKKYGIEVTEKEVTSEQQQAQNEKESLYIVLEFASKYYQEQLWKTPEGQSIGQSYFKERGFNHTTIQRFELGYSPDGWDAFTKHALRNGFSLEILEKAGLSIIKEGKDPIDRFRGRVIFPIHNVGGKPIAFGARILKKDPNAPKYLNSPETAVYHKSYIVYGIQQAKNPIRIEDNCYLVEGYTDVVSLSQAGVENVVASSGTSLTKEQIQLIRRFTSNITVLYDGDAAGIKASLRGIDIILEEGLNVKAVVFPDGDDPDSFIQKVGSQAFREYVNRTQKDFIRFKTEISLKDAGNDPIKRAEVIKDLVETISKIPDSIKRSVFYQEVANLMGIEEQILVTEGNKISLKKVADSEKERQRQNRTQTQQVGDIDILVERTEQVPLPIQEEKAENKRSPLSYQEEECARLLVCYGAHVLERNVVENIDFTLADYVFNEIRDMIFETPTYEKILSVFRDAYKSQQIPDTSLFTSHQDNEIQQTVINWLSTPHQLSENWLKKDIYIPSETDKLADLAYTNVLRLKKTRYESEMKKLAKQLETAQTYEEQDQILMQMMQMKEVVKKIAGLLGNVIQG
ncbi:DNA primase [Emticicia oligotrophica DSM 17448]|uniref:DNA primase n=1 Tax=Emticicia oligotrophica (strain DSM 17448 / CIP 109782 / MTCC 6937 / GPTSA100-15) TaxID=929562 RepID=A0ABM5MYL2_EMTOG|nr:DNA primase [Emticicia oligotrophica]AFK02208.1 DNA primase [Emticicia oligotrophica DSM 17448]